MPMESEDKGFAVVDKRGRQDASEPAAETASRHFSRTASGPSASPRTSPGATPRELDLTALFLMLASSAVVHLGKAPDPTTGVAQPDLAQARLCIDLLRVLREKTEGHRTTEESQLLEELLYDLQMHFVDAVGEASRSES
jgi:hypothetical protein